METSIPLLIGAGDRDKPGRLKRVLTRLVKDIVDIPCTGGSIQGHPLAHRLFHGSLWGLREKGVIGLGGGQFGGFGGFGAAMSRGVIVSLGEAQAQHSSVEGVIV